MISLPAIEAPLAEIYPPTEDGPRVAVEGREDIETGRCRIVLFTTESIERERANAILEAAGLSGLSRLHHVERIDAIPLLGTGKTDYRKLRARLESRTEDAAP